MAVLTWRNVDAPSFAASNDLLRLAGQQFNAGFESLDKTLTDFDKSREENTSAALMAQALAFQDPAKYAAALQNGTILNGVDPRNISKDAIDFLNNRVGDLTGDRQAAANLTGTNIINDTRRFDLNTAQSERARLEQMRQFQPAAYDLFVNARTLATSGDPANLAKAREIINNNTALFTNAGISIDEMLGMVGTNENAFQSGLTNNQNVRLAGDWWKDIANADDAKSVVSAVVKGSFSTEDAIKKIQSSGLSEPVKNKAIADLQANGANYFASPDIGDLLSLGSSPEALGAPPGMGLSESGNNFNAVNPDTGAAGRNQFIDARLQDAKDAGIIPSGMTLDQFRNDPVAQQTVEAWHWRDINNFIDSNELLDKYGGQTIKGAVMDREAMKAVAQLGGQKGLQKFLETGGQYDPADSNGTKLSDYAKKFSQGDPAAALTRSVTGTSGLTSTGNPYFDSLPIPGSASLDPTTPNSNGAPLLPGDAPNANFTTTLNNSLIADSINNTLTPIDTALRNGKYQGLSVPQIAQQLKEGPLSEMSISDITNGINKIARDNNISVDMAAILAENSVEGNVGDNLFYSEGSLLDKVLGTNYRINDERAKEILQAYRNPDRASDISRATARLNAFEATNKIPASLKTFDEIEAAETLKYQQALFAAQNGRNVNIEAVTARYQAVMNQLKQLRDDIGKTGYSGSVTNQFGRAQDAEPAK